MIDELVRLRFGHEMIVEVSRKQPIELEIEEEVTRHLARIVPLPLMLFNDYLSPIRYTLELLGEVEAFTWSPTIKKAVAHM